jgi:two-component system, response regulator
VACRRSTTETLTADEIGIIVVDDSASDAELTLLALNHLHPCPRALWLSDGWKAMDYLLCRGEGRQRSLRTLPSLVLSDIHMPSLSGLELLASIRSAPDLRAVPVIMLSGNATAREVFECYQLGATGYVEKSLAHETFTAELIQVVTKCLSTTDRCKPLHKSAP